MKPSEVVADAVAQAHCPHPEVRALTFEQFVSATAQLTTRRAEIDAQDGITDAHAFHIALMTALTQDFVPAAFSLKGTALGMAQFDAVNVMPALATEWPWVTLLDERGREMYRAMNDIYVIAAQRVAQEFESHGWLINTDSIA